MSKKLYFSILFSLIFMNSSFAGSDPYNSFLFACNNAMDFIFREWALPDDSVIKILMEKAELCRENNLDPKEIFWRLINDCNLRDGSPSELLLQKLKEKIFE